MDYGDGFIVLNSQHFQDETKFCGRGHLIIHFSENKKNQCSFKALSSSKNLILWSRSGVGGKKCMRKQVALPHFFVFFHCRSIE